MFPGWRRRKKNDKKFPLCLLVLILRKISAEGYNSSSHKSESVSSIPWNLLLDPSYTSHKISPASVSKNQVLFSPPSYGQSVAAASSSAQLWQRPPSSSTTSVSYSPQAYYTPSLSSASSTIEPMKYSIRIPNNYDEQPRPLPSNYYSKYHSHQQGGNPSVPASYSKHDSHTGTSHYQRDSQGYRYPVQNNNKVTFPGNTDYNSGYVTSSPYKKKTATKKKHKNSREKEKTRKPDDYFSFDDNQENVYQEYEDSYNYPYTEAASKDQRHTYGSVSTNSNDHPFSILTSSSSNSILNKAKDFLKFGSSLPKPSFSSSSDHYPKYSAQKQYPEYDSPSDPYASYHSSYSLDGTDDEYYSKGEYLKDPSSLYYYPPDYYDNHGLGDGKYDGPPIAIAEKKKSSKIRPLAFALGLLPLGLLLASLVPTVVTIPVTTAVATGRKRRRRETEFINPVLDTINAYGVKSLEDPMCLQQIFCSVVVGGKQNRSSVIQKLYYRGATLIEETWAEYMGLKMLLRAVKRDQCDLFPCHIKKTLLPPF